MTSPKLAQIPAYGSILKKPMETKMQCWIITAAKPSRGQRGQTQTLELLYMNIYIYEYMNPILTADAFAYTFFFSFRARYL